MKLCEVILKNFRGYYPETRIKIDNLTALIGKNDIGKSTILEALDIFFNQAKIDVGDRNVFHSDEETIIGCVFDELPTEITLEDAVTSFSGDYSASFEQLPNRHFLTEKMLSMLWRNLKHLSIPTHRR